MKEYLEMKKKVEAIIYKKIEKLNDEYNGLVMYHKVKCYSDGEYSNFLEYDNGLSLRWKKINGLSEGDLTLSEENMKVEYYRDILAGLREMEVELKDFLKSEKEWLEKIVDVNKELIE